MATYKVLQDIEAEDKLVGSLSFRQFVYALVAVFMLYISYISYSKHVSFILIITLPIMAFTGFLAFPFGKDQPTEVWALAKLRFLLKPRKRIWAQDGAKELVTITVPKKVELVLTDGLSQTEVKSRLQALANTIDSRGWVVKNVTNVYQSPLDSADSDRLIGPSAMPQNVPDYVISEADDVMDVSANPAAQQMDQLLNANGTLRRQQLIQSLNQISTAQAITRGVVTPPADNVVSPYGVSAASATTITPTEHINDPEMADELKTLNASQHSSLNNMRTLRPDGPAKSIIKSVNRPIISSHKPVAPASTKVPDPVIMNLSKRNDLNVTVIAHEASKAKAQASSNSGEVLISLH